MKQEVNIPYHVNSAVIKSHLSRLYRNEFIKQAKHIKIQAINLPFGNERRMYFELYKWCRAFYIKKYRH